MNFTQGFKAVVESLQREQVDFALIGGLALGVAGVARATMDIDFLVLRDDVLKVKRIMQSLGYALLHEGDGSPTSSTRMPVKVGWIFSTRTDGMPVRCSDELEKNQCSAVCSASRYSVLKTRLD